MNRLGTIAALGCCAALGACGGSSEATQEYLFSEINQFVYRVDRLPESAAAYNAMPVSGSADYNGNMYVETVNLDTSRVVLGETRISVDFGDGTPTSTDVTGTVDNFVGLSGDTSDFIELGVAEPETIAELQPYFDDGTLRAVNYEGHVDITSGTVGDLLPNAISLDYAGSVSGDGDNIAFAGTADGQFYGAPGVNVNAGFVALEEDATVIVNGDPDLYSFVGFVAIEQVFNP